ncbi:alternative ribosome rescue factor ArfA [Pseudomonas sp. F1_0610]|uniref:alternative ribosome rescue factor ArfA n=1 Tax=Pseudomonas sp. F1_0610 TaxID=3114284 RepID=UPI0039C0A052
MAKNKMKGRGKAKSMVAQPLYRSRTERAVKGKGSYNRKASWKNSQEAFLMLAA